MSITRTLLCSVPVALAAGALLTTGVRGQEAGQQTPTEHRFVAAAEGEAVATVTAGCARCDWGEAGREAVVLRVLVDGTYSQHLLLSRGEAPVPYRIMLGPLAAGEHRLTFERDEARSAKGAGAVRFESIGVTMYSKTAPEYEALSYAPYVHERPGTLARFSDLPIFAWVERAPAPGVGFRYSIIFTHEDGGTPTDRLMATWGRTTDVEFVYGRERTPDGVQYDEIQGRNHDILPFNGPRIGQHPLLWVSTDNNMVSDTGPADAVRFGLAPELVSLDGVSREVVMDRNPWTYSVMASELRREGRIDQAAAAGSAKIPDPRQFAYLEGCAEMDRALFAFDVATRSAGGDTQWHGTDRGEPRWRIARAGCFRAAVPLPPQTKAEMITGVRLRAYTRPRRDGEPILPRGTGSVRLNRFNGVFMLDGQYRPGPSRLASARPIEARGEAEPVVVSAGPSADRKD
jgi:hypothetical protein